MKLRFIFPMCFAALSMLSGCNSSQRADANNTVDNMQAKSDTAAAEIDSSAEAAREKLDDQTEDLRESSREAAAKADQSIQEGTEKAEDKMDKVSQDMKQGVKDLKSDYKNAVTYVTINDTMRVRVDHPVRDIKGTLKGMSVMEYKIMADKDCKVRMNLISDTKNTYFSFAASNEVKGSPDIQLYDGKLTKGSRYNLKVYQKGKNVMPSGTPFELKISLKSL